jgi:hypothetical protein
MALKIEACNGCCVSLNISNVSSFDELVKNTTWSTINYVWIEKSKQEIIDQLNEMKIEGIDYDKVVLFMPEGTAFVAIRNKEFIDRHNELQTRDGRKEEQFEIGDVVTFKNNPRFDIPNPSRVKRANFKQYGSDYVCLECYDNYYKKYLGNGAYPTSSLWRI